ncbi:hypothetical protein BCR44DRAFT_156215 [Catenaria anguillulae PL171]|uniref:PSI domain-containing protein n=1 Tax=Catenaria anguillulae PL171 TaxID=765915 RepID=A0A1Y2HI81_9FUNG|nr:hypothetical protein BCR44DRAFT_156215 [Catenaria anguillulae PL171]
MKHFIALVFSFVAFMSFAALASAQGITVNPPAATATIAPPPLATSAPDVNCTALRTCSDCVKNGACGWCGVNDGTCIRAFNPLHGQGTGIDACYGQTDQFFLFQCSIGAKTASILAIAGGIVAGFILMFLITCMIRMRRSGTGNSAFTRMVDDFDKRYGKGNKKGGAKEAKKKKEPAQPMIDYKQSFMSGPSRV